MLFLQRLRPHLRPQVELCLLVFLLFDRNLRLPAHERSDTCGLFPLHLIHREEAPEASARGL